MNSRIRRAKPCISCSGMETRPQSKLESLIEQICNVGSGMILAFTIAQLILWPALGLQVSPNENMVITIVLTFVSVVRGYIWRRIFNKRLYRAWAEKIRSLKR